MKLELTRTAMKDLDQLEQKIRGNVNEELYKLRDNKARFKKLKGQEHTGRLRVGEYRVIFEISGETIYIKTVKHRREAYRNL